VSAAGRELVIRYRQERAWLLGLCGVRFGWLGVCDEPAGHPPIAPPHWLHSARVGDSPLGDVVDELVAAGRCHPATGRHVTPHVGCVLR
jgi:hypothetical protein